MVPSPICLSLCLVAVVVFMVGATKHHDQTALRWFGFVVSRSMRTRRAVVAVMMVVGCSSFFLFI